MILGRLFTNARAPRYIVGRDGTIAGVATAPDTGTTGTVLTGGFLLVALAGTLYLYSKHPA